MIETDPAVTVRQVTDSRQVRDSGCADWRARGSDGVLIDRETGNGFATVGRDEDYDDETLLLRVLSDVRRAYCRQPLSGLAVDDSCLPGIVMFCSKNKWLRTSSHLYFLIRETTFSTKHNFNGQT